MDAPWTAVHDTPNKSIRQNVARKGVVLHHAAMTSLDGLRTMEVQGTKEVSSTAICKDGHLELVVPDSGYRPWSLSSAWADSAFRSIETCNESTNGWTVSDASHWSLARAVAYWATTDGFRPHREGDPSTWTVIGHREVNEIYGVSYSTACPGALDLDLVTQRAQDILNGTGAKAQIGDITMRYISAPNRGDLDAQGLGGAIVAAEGFFPYSRATHGDLAPEYAQTASKLFNGIGVTEREWDVARQDALNRAAAIKAAQGAGVDPGTLASLIGSAVKIALAGAKVEAEVDVPSLVKSVSDELARRLQS